MFQFITLILSLSFVFPSFAADKRAPASAAGKAAAMKYLQGRKPAQEAATTGDQMLEKLSELMAILDSAAPNTDKKKSIDEYRYELGKALKYLIIKSKSANDDELQKKGYVVDNVMMYFSNLKLDSKGHWTDSSCRQAMTQAHINGYNPATEQIIPATGDDSALGVIERLCGFKLNWGNDN